jgi:uncharacterized protein (TIGR02246 family)
VPLSIEDRLSVQDAVTRYAYLADYDGTEEDFLGLFTEDGVLGSPISGEHSGVDGIRKFARGLIKRREDVQMRHYMTNLTIDGDGDHATVKAHMLQFMTYRAPIRPRPGLVTEFLFAGRYDFVLRKVDGRWRIQRRTVYVDAQAKPKAEGLSTERGISQAAVGEEGGDRP